MDSQQLLKKMLDKRSITAKELSEKTGYSYNAVLSWTSGKRQPTFTAIQDCAQACGYTFKLEREEEWSF
jgi:transcriptional regulator with XRE-family HTH domain